MASTEKGPTVTKKAGTKAAGVKTPEDLKAAVSAFGKKAGSMTPEQKKKAAARLKASKQRLGMKGTLKGN